MFSTVGMLSLGTGVMLAENGRMVVDMVVALSVSIVIVIAALCLTWHETQTAL